MMIKIAILLQCFLLLCTQSVRGVNIEMVTVGNPGNAADRQFNSIGIGSVGYVYRIGKYEVTNAQYTEFLNAADSTGTNLLALYHPNMSSYARGGIIFNDDAANGSKYEVKPGHDRNPVNYISFLDAARFVNWLNNGQGSNSTESGAYSITNGGVEGRNSTATYFLPNEDEWYKAAYHKNDGTTGNYWYYPICSDDIPFSDQPPGSDAPVQSNTANFYRDDGVTNGYNDGYAVTGTPNLDLNNTQNYFTDVGAYTSSVSPYGTFDQGGNAWEWNETAFGSSTLRGLLGGGFSSPASQLAARFRDYRPISGEAASSYGFRIAAAAPIPEPTSLTFFSIAAVMLGGSRLRTRRGKSS